MESRLLGLPDDQILAEGRKLLEKVCEEVEKVAFGNEIQKLVRHLLIAALADGHVLVEAHIGIGKTLTCNALARAIAGTARRRQFRPDMLPSELSGFEVWNPKTQRWEIRHGLLYGTEEEKTTIFLADEINRATPKAQAALLEAMQERHITVGKETYPLADLFLVLATLNPIEYEGTYSLPEAQLDRFFGRAGIDYPSEETEMLILENDEEEEWAEDRERLAKVNPVMTPKDIIVLRQAISRSIYTGERIKRYIIRLRAATWKHEAVETGASPRGPKYLARAAKITAFLEGWDYVTPEHVRENGEWVLAHRIFMRAQYRRRYGGELKAVDIIREILDRVPEPKGDFRP